MQSPFRARFGLHKFMSSIQLPGKQKQRKGDNKNQYPDDECQIQPLGKTGKKIEDRKTQGAAQKPGRQSMRHGIANRVLPGHSKTIPQSEKRRHGNKETQDMKSPVGRTF